MLTVRREMRLRDFAARLRSAVWKHKYFYLEAAAYEESERCFMGGG